MPCPCSCVVPGLGLGHSQRKALLGSLVSLQGFPSFSPAAIPGLCGLGLSRDQSGHGQALTQGPGGAPAPAVQKYLPQLQIQTQASPDKSMQKFLFPLEKKWEGDRTRRTDL